MGEEDKVHILLVDDRPENLISLSATLDSPSYHLVMAESGRDALRCLLDQDFALILLDVQMPIMDGFETAALIKQRERSKHIPIIFITAVSADSPFLFKGYGAGAVDYIVKPFDPRILRSKVAVFAELHQKRIQVQRQAALLREHERVEREREMARVELESLRREQAAKDKYRDLVEGIKDGVVWTVDLETLSFSYISMQAKRILGGPISERRFEEEILRHPAFVEKSADLRIVQADCDVKKMDFSFEHPIKTDLGSVLWFQTSVRLAEIAGSKRYELRGLSVDITRVKAAQEEAQKAIQVRDEFLSIASHELKTPLTPLRLQLESLQLMAKRGHSADAVYAKVLGSLDRSHRQVDRLNKLIDELLDVSRINNGRLYLEKDEVNLSVLIRDVAERFNQDPNRTASAIRLNLMPQVSGSWDRLRIEQVVTNLITNAQKYGNGKPIEISLQSDGQTACLTFRDYGIGISKADQQRIFALYERAVSPANFGGLGLGLYIVKQIVTAHGGTIEVESELGQGTTFTVQLPLHAVETSSPDGGCAKADAG